MIVDTNMLLCEPLQAVHTAPKQLAQRRRGSLSWRAEVDKEATSAPVKRVCFSYSYYVQEFDPTEAPHACNPSPFLELTEHKDEESGVTVQRFRFEFDTCESSNSPRAEFHFETNNPEWSAHNDGVRSRLLCIRHNAEASAIDGAFFIENRSTNCGFGAKHNAFVRYTTNGWTTHTDVACVTTQLAAFDAVHRFSCPFPSDIADGSTLEFAFCFQIADREFWNSNDSRNYRSTLHQV